MPAPSISQQKLYAASQGNASLLEVLQQVAQTTAQSQAASGTTPTAVATTAGQPNSAAPVPAQATGSVSILNGAYIVQLINPGGTNPISQLQAAQAAGNANLLTALQPVQTIFHQIRASTSPAFNVSSNTQTFGGTTGSTQTYWTLTSLGTGTWYVQFRSSFDGINFNTWKNANGGTALGGLINQVTTQAVGDSEWAVFTAPGKLIAGIGAGLIPDQGTFELAEQVYSSGMFAIAGPNGFSAQNQGVYGVTLCDVDIQTGDGQAVGIPDYPVVIRMQYGIYESANVSPGNANVFAIAFDPSNENVTLYPDPAGGGAWATFKLPGGATIAIGQGTTPDGGTIWTPPALSWLNAARMMSIVTLTDAVGYAGLVIQGYNKAQLSGLTMEASSLTSGGGASSVTGNWLAIAWVQGTDVQTIAGAPWIKINLQGGHAMYIGAGQAASGSPITLPDGCTTEQMLSIAIPGGTNPTGNHLRGVNQCAFEGLTPFLQYTDNSNFWDGQVNWMVACWI